MFEALIIVALQVVAGEPAAPQQQQTVETEDRAQAAQDGESDEQLICQDYPRIGSRIPRRLCMTERERRELRARQQEALRQFTRPGDVCYHC